MALVIVIVIVIEIGFNKEKLPVKSSGNFYYKSLIDYRLI